MNKPVSATIDAFLNLTGGRRLPLIRQAEAAECGLACIAMVAGWHGYDTDLTALRRRFPISLKGVTLRELIEIAGRVGLGARALRCELAELKNLRAPCILHWEMKHFVVLKRVSADRVWLHDPALGARVMNFQEISPYFTGVALELTPTPQFKKKRERKPVKLSALWAWTPETISALVQGFILSVMLELFVVLNPFYMQLVIDEAILKGDHDLLTGLAVAFGLLCLFNIGAGALRSLVFQFLANTVSFDMESRLFHHLIRLPLDYFNKRHLGDLLQRFHALEAIKQLIVNGGISALLDGSLAIFTGILMLVYSPKLGLIVIGVFLSYAAIRIGARSISRRYTADVLVAEAHEQTRFLETIQAIQTIKVSGGETNRESLWRNLYAAKMNSGIKAGNLGIVYQNLNGMLTGLSDVVILFLAARDAMDATLTVGMISAFMAYKGQFMGRMTALLDQAINFLMLDVQLDRIGDIALAPREIGMDSMAADEIDLVGRIEVKNLNFRYAPSEPPTIRSLNLTIEPGEFVAIIGGSGEGKSTLLKLLIGLYQPTGGVVLIDGRTPQAIGTATFRRQLGVVMQEDQLLSGTIAENIALFDEAIDMARVMDCARSALIHEEIIKFPMQYNSLVGDMGTTLSSGQKQRVLIARALYRRPRVMVLDEGTAHLDPPREEAMNQMIRSLDITRIAVAHSPAMVRAADRVLELRDGRLHRVFPPSEPLLGAEKMTLPQENTTFA